ncbi:MAG TPA: GWxTD domain-containing protein, partial [Candidatus Kapabacteria bacterium]|nr:GWxTD domain-containing protein [Candidatus Kapabacteria bacterium]
MVAPGPRVVFDLLAFKQPGANPVVDSTRMDLYLAVDYNSLEFLYAIDKYVADYSVTVQVIAKVDDRSSSNLILDRYEAYTVLESTTEHHARVQHDQNASPVIASSTMRRADAQQLSFLLTPGMLYTMRLSIQDFSSRSTFDTSFDFRVTDFATASPAMSDLLIFRDRQGRSIIPSIGPDVSSLTEGINDKFPNDIARGSSGLFAELYNMPADSTVGIVTEITQGSGDMHASNSAAHGAIISRTTTTLHIPPVSGTMSTAPATNPVTPLFAPVSFDGLWTGYYIIHIYVLPSAQDTTLNDPSALETRAITSAMRQVLVTIAQGIPISVGDLDRAIEQLGVIATGHEWDSLSNAHTPKQKRDAILDFWQKKNSFSSALRRDDQNRAMEVFYSRVEYANAHFGTTFQAGWKSDRGHIYIALGPPDLIDSHPQGYEASSTMRQAYG